jgi:hypothetical protein
MAASSESLWFGVKTDKLDLLQEQIDALNKN